MAAAKYESNFAAVLPVLRDRDKILADLYVPASAGATELSKAKVAQIELQVKNGDEAFNKGNYASALAPPSRRRGRSSTALSSPPSTPTHSLGRAWTSCCQRARP
jgi:hypothetical protein